MLILFLVWLTLAFIIGVVADTRGRWGVGWALLAVIISPLFASVLLLLLPNAEPPSVVNEAPIRNIQTSEPVDQTSDQVNRWVWRIIIVVAILFVLYSIIINSTPS